MKHASKYPENRLKHITFMSKDMFEDMIPCDDWLVISITSPGEDPPRNLDGWYNVLPLQFDDFIGDSDKASEVLIEMPDGTIRHPVLFSEEMALLVIDSVIFHSHIIRGIAIHCHAGISRSAGIARCIAARFHIPFDFQYDLFNRNVYQCMDETWKSTMERSWSPL